jgi:sarcosine oxidase subunit beta
MTAARRVVVVGAGVMGLSAAVEMSSIPGFEVTVIDRAYAGGGSTSRSAGVYTRQYLTERDIELRARSVEALYALEAAGLILLRRIGFLRIGRDQPSRELFAQSVALQEELGVQDPGRLIEPDEIARLVPDYNRDGIDSGLWCPTEGYLDGGELCTVLAEKAQAHGTRLMVRTALHGARRGARCRFELGTDAGDLEADLVINCAGAWAEEVGEILEAPVPMLPERHEAYTFELPRTLTYAVPMVMDYVPDGPVTEGLYFRQEGEHQLIAGMHSVGILGTHHADPHGYFEGVTEAGTDSIVGAMLGAFPDLDVRFRGGWAGLYPYSADGLPIAGPHPANPNVLVGAGLHGVGLSLGPAMGKLLAEWAQFGEPRSIEGAIDMVPRDLNRAGQAKG